jgi:hypothetical protein
MYSLYLLSNELFSENSDLSGVRVLILIWLLWWLFDICQSSQPHHLVMTCCPGIIEVIKISLFRVTRPCLFTIWCLIFFPGYRPVPISNMVPNFFPRSNCYLLIVYKRSRSKLWTLYLNLWFIVVNCAWYWTLLWIVHSHHPTTHFPSTSTNQIDLDFCCLGSLTVIRIPPAPEFPPKNLSAADIKIIMHQP